MIRCTIELLSGGKEDAARVIGLIEIVNVGGTREVGEYAVTLKKTPPFNGALKTAWKTGRFTLDDHRHLVLDHEAVPYEDAEIVVVSVDNHHRTRRGSYDLLYRALKACGLDGREPR